MIKIQDYPDLTHNFIQQIFHAATLHDVGNVGIYLEILKKSWSHPEALVNIITNQNIRFDPLIIEAFLVDQEKFIRIFEECHDN